MEPLQRFAGVASDAGRVGTVDAQLEEPVGECLELGAGRVVGVAQGPFGAELRKELTTAAAVDLAENVVGHAAAGPDAEAHAFLADLLLHGELEGLLHGDAIPVVQV